MENSGRYGLRQRLRMSKVNTAYFLANRLATDKGGRTNSVMVRVATLSVVIGLSVMILALGIIFGFKREISEKMTGMMSQVQIQHYQQNISYETPPISSEQPFLEAVRNVPGFSHMNSYAVKPGILKGADAIQGIMLKGVGADFDWSFFRDNLIEGELPVVGDSTRNKDVLISRRLAQQMQLGIGDKTELMFVQNPPRRDLFRIRGIYDTGMQDVDNVLMITDIRNVQRLNNWRPDQVSGFELSATDFREVERFSDDVFEVLYNMAERIPEQLMVTNIRESNPMIFDWLDTHDLNAAIIIVVMLLVAVFNMIAALLIILLEKTPMIGILKALGMPNRSIQKMFLIRSSHIILKGMFWGNAIGLALCYIQHYTGVLKLDAEGYFLTHVPVYVNWMWIGLLNLGVFVVTLLLLTLPTLIVSRILPEKSIRFE